MTQINLEYFIEINVIESMDDNVFYAARFKNMFPKRFFGVSGRFAVVVYTPFKADMGFVTFSQTVIVMYL
ncbi:MAG: hypothetical protein LDLANPLL_01827 [Turneriella sp.]|nr:hypothetical protein [Turneriella sp.]